jgi:hypothetical protein
LALLALVPPAPASAFVCLRTQGDSGPCLRWAQGGAVLKSFLGVPPNAPLINGTLSWDQNAINAANDWNAAGIAFHFDPRVGGDFFDPCGPRGAAHVCHNTGPAGDNPIQFVDSACGGGFGDIVAATTSCFDAASGAMLNAPVFVNRNVDWNAYDGPIRVVNARVVHDLRRVILHEFGHVLGLDHPDMNDQAVVAIMNSRESSVDRLQSDDVSGGFSLYPNAPAPSGTNTGCQLVAGVATRAWWLLIVPPLLGVMRRRGSPNRRATRSHLR